MKDPANRSTCSVRINDKLYAYVKEDAEEKGMSLVEYVNKLYLAKVIHDNEGTDIFECLSR
jgi:predicted HicB family RNase H-like nuclease